MSAPVVQGSNETWTPPPAKPLDEVVWQSNGHHEAPLLFSFAAFVKSFRRVVSKSIINQTVDETYPAGIGGPRKPALELMNTGVHESLPGHDLGCHLQRFLYHWFHSGREWVEDRVADLQVLALDPRRGEVNDPTYVRHFGEVWRTHKAVAKVLAQDLARCRIHLVVVTQRRVTVALSDNDILAGPLYVENAPARPLIGSNRKTAEFCPAPVCNYNLRSAGVLPGAQRVLREQRARRGRHPILTGAHTSQERQCHRHSDHHP